MEALVDSKSAGSLATPTVSVPRRHPVDSDDSVLRKVHQLLKVFSPTVTQLGLTELSHRSGVPKATTYRLAMQLVELGVLVKVGTKYQLGWAVFEMGQYVAGPAGLSAVARPTLYDLRTATNALLVHLAIARGKECVYLERIAGRREVPLLLSRKVPILSSASGRVLMANRDSRREVVELLVPKNPEGVLAQLETIRTRRWASDEGSLMPGLTTYAAPVFLADGHTPAAAISVSISAKRKDHRNVLHALWSAAADIGRTLSI